MTNFPKMKKEASNESTGSVGFLGEEFMKNLKNAFCSDKESSDESKRIELSTEEAF